MAQYVPAPVLRALYILSNLNLIPDLLGRYYYHHFIDKEKQAPLFLKAQSLGNLEDR